MKKPRRRLKRKDVHYDMLDENDRLIRRLMLQHIVYLDVKIGSGPAAIMSNGDRITLSHWDYRNIRVLLGIPHHRDDPDN